TSPDPFATSRVRPGFVVAVRVRGAGADPTRCPARVRASDAEKTAFGPVWIGRLPPALQILRWRHESPAGAWPAGRRPANRPRPLWVARNPGNNPGRRQGRPAPESSRKRRAAAW